MHAPRSQVPPAYITTRERSRSRSGNADVSRRNALLLLAALTLVWGCNFPVMKIALGEVPIWWFRSACVIFGGVGLLSISAAGGARISPRGRDVPAAAGDGCFRGRMLAYFYRLRAAQHAGRTRVDHCLYDAAMGCHVRLIHRQRANYRSKNRRVGNGSCRSHSLDRA